MRWLLVLAAIGGCTSVANTRRADDRHHVLRLHHADRHDRVRRRLEPEIATISADCAPCVEENEATCRACRRLRDPLHHPGEPSMAIRNDLDLVWSSFLASAPLRRRSRSPINQRRQRHPHRRNHHRRNRRRRHRRSSADASTVARARDVDPRHRQRSARATRVRDRRRLRAAASGSFDLQTPNIASVRLRLISGLTFEPTITIVEHVG